MKKTPLFLLAALLLALPLAGCGEEKAPAADTTGATESSPAASTARYTEDGRRIITIGTWYDRYYFSKHSSIEDDPELANPETAQIRLDRMRELEQKYNIVLDTVNLTFNGVQESINTSIPQGAPDVDIYEVDVQFGIPAALNGYAISLEEMGLQGTDVFATQQVMTHLSLLGQDQSFLFAPASTGGIGAYVLAFNLDMLRAAGLENPQDLYDRGEWTWAKWREYLQELTVDTDSDGVPEVYGFGGYWTNLLGNLLMSNGTGIASGQRETLSSPEALEVLEFIHTIYTEDKTARPWDHSNWNINNELYAAGLSGFWIGADWLFGEQGGAELPFEIGVVPWPCGPSGDPETNRHSQPKGNWYFIPKGVENPRLVYDVLYDWINWYDGDLDLGVDLDWSRSMYMTDRNFSYAQMMDTRPGFDMWENLGVDFSIVPMTQGELTPQELADQNSALFQDALDRYFGGQ